MKIETHDCQYKWHDLSTVCVNSVVKFASQFHQDMTTCDPFLVLNTCNSYRDQARSTRGRIAVVNLRTSKLSFVVRDRRVRIIDATVRIND
jgi:hypothetical protein